MCVLSLVDGFAVCTRRRTIAVRSLAWLKAEPHEDDVKIVDYWHEMLKEMVELWQAPDKVKYLFHLGLQYRCYRYMQIVNTQLCLYHGCFLCTMVHST